MEGRGSATSLLAVVAMVLVLVMAPGARAVTHIVGGTNGWNYAPSNDLKYYDSTWAANQTFAVGDILQFQYTPGAHDVVQLNSSADYAACTGAKVKTYTTGNDMVTLPVAGTYFFICDFPSHCTLGMKVSVTVGTAAAPATPPSTTPSPPAVPSPPPPPGNAASSGPALSMAGLLIAALMASSLAFRV